jgi:WD repeat-containing protein 19
MFETAGMLEKAAAIYVAAKNFAAAAPLMAQISSPQLQRQYARAKEAEARWAPPRCRSSGQQARKPASPAPTACCQRRSHP